MIPKNVGTMKHLILRTVITAVLFFGFTVNAATSGECYRECLKGFINKYLKKLLTHDASKLPVTKNVKYTENGVRLNLTDGLWQTASAMTTYRVDVIDEEAGQVALLGRINENGNNNFFALRLKI